MKDLEGNQDRGSESVEIEHVELDRLLARYSLPVQKGFAASIMKTIEIEDKALDRALARDFVKVREKFVDQIMACLPEPSWQRSSRERRSAKQWLVAAAIAIALASVGGLLLRSDPATSSVLGSVAALGDLVVGTLLAGASLLQASWSGLRTTVGGAMAESPSSFVALGFAVVLLNLLLFRLLRRRHAAVGGRVAATVVHRDDR